jgi:hypothetical protein
MPPASARPPLPDTVRNAFYLMLAGAALQLVGVLSVLGQADVIRDAIREASQGDPSLSPSAVDRTANGVITAILVFGLVVVALWIWMALANRAGKNWARVTATVFFGLASLFTIIGLLFEVAGTPDGNAVATGTTGSALGMVINILSWIVGLITIVLLWSRASSAYFRPQIPYGFNYPYQGPVSDYPVLPPGAVPPGQPGAPPAGPQSQLRRPDAPPDFTPPS